MKRDFWRNVKLLLARLSHLDVNEQQQRELDYLREENQTLRDCLKSHREKNDLDRCPA